MAWLGRAPQPIRHKCFISYHHADEAAVRRFIGTFDDNRDVFISRSVGMTGDIIDSNDPEYVMRRIRELYLSDSTVTIVLIGRCTWARKYVDWEVASTLRNDLRNKRSGLMGIVLPSAATSLHVPERLNNNLPDKPRDGYARCYRYPPSVTSLANMIEDAYGARDTRAHLIAPRSLLFKQNRECP